MTVGLSESDITANYSNTPVPALSGPNSPGSIRLLGESVARNIGGYLFELTPAQAGQMWNLAPNTPPTSRVELHITSLQRLFGGTYEDRLHIRIGDVWYEDLDNIALSARAITGETLLDVVQDKAKEVAGTSAAAIKQQLEGELEGKVDRDVFVTIDSVNNGSGLIKSSTSLTTEFIFEVTIHNYSTYTTDLTTAIPNPTFDIGGVSGVTSTLVRDSRHNRVGDKVTRLLKVELDSTQLRNLRNNLSTDEGEHVINVIQVLGSTTYRPSISLRRILNLPFGSFTDLADAPGGYLASAGDAKKLLRVNDACLLYTSPSPRDS